MCGFLGFLRNQPGEGLPRSLLNQMGASLRLRGPDEQAVYTDDHLSLVFRRLSIVDVKGGSQPIWNEQHTVFVAVNGEIYNHQALKDELLPDTPFTSHSDSEVVLHLYLRYGADCVNYLNGMFSFVVWDTRDNHLFLARDRLGIKPLYYTELAEGLLFASELKALLLHPDCPRELNWHDLQQPGPQQTSSIASYVQGVYHFPAGHYAHSHTGKLAPRAYWDIKAHYPTPSTQPKSNAQLQTEYHELLHQAVNKRLMADVPVGLFLSGGVDSSLMAAMLAKKQQALHCFTVVERSTYQAGDVLQAKKLAESLGLPFYPIYFDTDALAKNFDLSLLENQVCLIESPRFDPEWYFKSELHRAAKAAVPELKVILLGQGADEFCGGYSNYLGSEWASWREYLDYCVTPSLAASAFLEKDVPVRLSVDVNYQSISDERAVPLYNQHMTKLSYQLQHFNLWHEDRTSAYHGIESRVPYLDHTLVEFLAGISEQQQASLFWNKAILRHSAALEMPSYPTEHPKVPFFVTDDTASIDNFAKVVASNCYADFCRKYVDSGLCPFTRTALDSLYAGLAQGQPLNAWPLIEMMTVTIFQQYCAHPQDYLDAVFFVESEPLPQVMPDEWAGLAERFEAAPTMSGEWRMDSVVDLLVNSEIVNPLTEAEGATALILLQEGREAKRITISDEFDWIVMLLDAMGRERASPKDVAFWVDKLQLPAEQVVGVLQELVAGGFIRRC